MFKRRKCDSSDIIVVSSDIFNVIPYLFQHVARRVGVSKCVFLKTE